MDALRRCLLLFAALLSLTSCSQRAGTVEQYVDYVYQSMNLADDVAKPRAYWEANVAKTLEVRDRMQWGVPEREFRYFVLPIRVGMEALDDFRTLYADTLCARVAGMSMEEAALEINHWCLEMATFQLTTGWTMSPMQIIQQGAGRCNEEAVLVVAALRAAGLPARLANAPHWSHIDGAHAWAEVWTDGQWHFMGACEPESHLDIAWINDVVARAHVISSPVVGKYKGPEPVLARSSQNSKINLIHLYAPTRRSVVRVVDPSGRPVRRARVECKVYNAGEYVTLHSRMSDFRGRVTFEMGYGDLIVWASKAGRFGLAKLDGEEAVVTLDHVPGESFQVDYDLVIPAERQLPQPKTEADEAANGARVAVEDSIRNSRPHGNADVLSAFLTAHPGEQAADLLSSLDDHDLDVVPLDVLEDAFAHIDGTFRPLRDCPRIEQEPLKPFFSLLQAGVSLDSPAAVDEWVDQHIQLVSWYNPQGVRMAPADVWQCRKADRRSRDIFRVALCRAMGFEATYGALDPDARVGRVDVTFEGVMPTDCDQHFSISRIEAQTTRRIPLGEDGKERRAWEEIFPLTLEEGCYMLTTGVRLADYSVLSHTAFFRVTADSTTVVPLRLRDPGARAYVWGMFNAGPFIPVAARGYYLVVELGDRDEATRECLRQLDEAQPLLESWGQPVFVTGPAGERLLTKTDARPLSQLSHLVSFDDADGAIQTDLLTGCRLPSPVLPLVAIADGWGRIVYVSRGADPTLAENLRRIIPQIDKNAQ